MLCKVCGEPKFGSLPCQNCGKKKTKAAKPQSGQRPRVVAKASTTQKRQEGAKPSKKSGPKTAGAQAQARWREAHPEEWKAYNREYQKKRRARIKKEGGNG